MTYLPGIVGLLPLVTGLGRRTGEDVVIEDSARQLNSYTHLLAADQKLAMSDLGKNH